MHDTEAKVICDRMCIIVSVIPKEAVKYFVENHANDSGLVKARPANRTVHRGNRVVRVSVVFR